MGGNKRLVERFITIRQRLLLGARTAQSWLGGQRSPPATRFPLAGPGDADPNQRFISVGTCSLATMASAPVTPVPGHRETRESSVVLSRSAPETVSGNSAEGGLSGAAARSRSRILEAGSRHTILEEQVAEYGRVISEGQVSEVGHLTGSQQPSRAALVDLFLNDVKLPPEVVSAILQMRDADLEGDPTGSQQVLTQLTWENSRAMQRIQRLQEELDYLEGRSSLTWPSVPEDGFPFDEFYAEVPQDAVGSDPTGGLAFHNLRLEADVSKQGFL